MRLCLRCFVSGHVQGVWYRDTTRRKALELGLTGYARNLSDGRVEVLACGEESAVTALRDWLWEGSRHARVTDVHSERIDYQGLTGFLTG